MPRDDADRDTAFKQYRLYARAGVGAWSKILQWASDEAADEEEKAAALEALCLMCYQLDLTAFDWRLSVFAALVVPLISRLPAIEKKWRGPRKLDAKAAALQTMEAERAKAAPAPPPVTPAPEPERIAA